MLRLTVLPVLLATALPALAQPAVLAQPAAQTLDLRSEIAASRVGSGPYAGGYKLNRAAAGLNFYFAAQGLRAVATDRAWSLQVGAFLDLYLRQADPAGGWIDDVRDLATGTTQLSDSDDSYAAYLMILAGDYYGTPAGRQWWKRNGGRVKRIADQVLLANQLPNGLVSAYSQQRDFSDSQKYLGLTPEERAFKAALQKSAYLMDSCEVFGGLRALVNVLVAERDPSTGKYSTAALKVARGIASLYRERARAFYVLDTDKRDKPNFYAPGEVRFYPHRTAQAFPQLFGVPLGSAASTKERYDNGWRFLNAGRDGTTWADRLPSDGTTAPFPWMVLGYVARLRGENALAQRQLDWHQRELAANPDNFAFLYIHEVGYALRNCSLAGRPAGPR